MKKAFLRALIVIIVFLVLSALTLVVSGCSSHHYFSINAEEITNPQITYSDSTRVTNPF